MFNRGQTLIEVIVVITVGLLVVAALTFATLFAIRSSQVAQNQSQATKLAQEGIEKIKSDRDRGGKISSTLGGYPNQYYPVTSWKDDGFWNWSLFSCSSSRPNYGRTYFKFGNGDEIIYFGCGVDPFSSNRAELVNNNKFQRAIKIMDKSSTYQVEKEVEVTVKWSDFSGAHETKQNTILRRL